jgi:hypothetical protein
VKRGGGFRQTRRISIRWPKMHASGRSAVGGRRRQWLAASSGGARRRDPIQGSGPQFDARRAPTRGARSGEAGRGGGRGGEAAKRPVDAAVWVRSPARSLRVPQCTRSSTNGTSGLLTSRRSSLAASRRRNDDDGEDSTAAAARVCGRRTGGRGRLGWGNSMGGARLK